MFLSFLPEAIKIVLGLLLLAVFGAGYITKRRREADVNVSPPIIVVEVTPPVP